MADVYTSIPSSAAFEELMSEAGSEPIIVFKHDPYCPMSMRAFDELQEFEDKVVMVDVAHQKDVAREIMLRTGIKHESPQVIVMHRGEPRWSASHYAITRSRVEQALRDVD